MRLWRHHGGVIFVGAQLLTLLIHNVHGGHRGMAFAISRRKGFFSLTKNTCGNTNWKGAKGHDIIPTCDCTKASMALLATNQDSSNSRVKSSPWSEANRRLDGNSSEKQHHGHCYLCVITDTNACDSTENVQNTIRTLELALGVCNLNSIDLISIRVTPPLSSDDVTCDQFQQRIVELATQLMTMKAKHQSHPLYNDYKVVINDALNLQAAMEANIDGIHVKERDVEQIPYIRSTLQKHLGKDIIVGTSAHSISSGVINYQLYKPDYMFVGTCYLTHSHPEKNACDLEGPTLPGLVKEAIRKETDGGQQPIIFAIGGIESENCHEPVGHGSDGVAVIRSVMQASDPALAVKFIKKGMMDSIRR